MSGKRRGRTVVKKGNTFMTRNIMKDWLIKELVDMECSQVDSENPFSVHQNGVKTGKNIVIIKALKWLI